MTMGFRHEEQAVLMQYGGGDPCPPGKSAILTVFTTPSKVLQSPGDDALLHHGPRTLEDILHNNKILKSKITSPKMK